MRIGELARLTGTSTHTLRFYEASGLIQSTRRANNYRDYPNEMVAIVNLIRMAGTLGFTLAEIAPELAGREIVSDPARLRALFESRIKAVDERIGELQELREHLSSMMERTCPITGIAAIAGAKAP